jgi:hypothetical protein
MDHVARPVSADEQERGTALLARIVQNYEGLQRASTLAGMETTLFSPDLGGEAGGAEAVRVLRAMRSHLQDGYELHVQLLSDLDEVLAIVDGT